MTKPLLSPSQMASLQEVAEAGMQVDVIIKRPDWESDDLGDGAYDVEPTTVAEVKGYLRHRGGDTVAGVDSGRLVVTSTLELAVPIGTDVRARDLVIINDRTFYVQDVHDDETWPAMLDLTLRRRE